VRRLPLQPDDLAVVQLRCTGVLVGRKYESLHMKGVLLHPAEKLLADIATAIKNREMQLPQYTLVHRYAELSEANVDAVYNWAHGRDEE
jgi:hypothetical protein